mmetsp:Transcript_23009/g.57776  ORF Transcript_23009/g.57776 Transcript_23009/m.57776 type:complete len:333 (-) Transcript_23009:660-1658(-)
MKRWTGTRHGALAGRRRRLGRQRRMCCRPRRSRRQRRRTRPHARGATVQLRQTTQGRTTWRWTRRRWRQMGRLTERRRQGRRRRRRKTTTSQSCWMRCRRSSKTRFKRAGDPASSPGGALVAPSAPFFPAVRRRQSLASRVVIPAPTWQPCNRPSRLRPAPARTETPSEGSPPCPVTSARTAPLLPYVVRWHGRVCCSAGQPARQRRESSRLDTSLAGLADGPGGVDGGMQRARQAGALPPMWTWRGATGNATAGHCGQAWWLDGVRCAASRELSVVRPAEGGPSCRLARQPAGWPPTPTSPYLPCCRSRRGWEQIATSWPKAALVVLEGPC